MADASMRRAMLEFCRGGAHGFSDEELEQIRSAAFDAILAKDFAEKTAEARLDAELASHTMGKGWTNVRLLMEPERRRTGSRSLWDIPLRIPLFIPTGGYRNHVFVGPAKESGVQAVCAVFRGTELETVRTTFEGVRSSVRTLKVHRRDLCQKCWDPAPYELRWVPPQRTRA